MKSSLIEHYHTLDGVTLASLDLHSETAREGTSSPKLRNAQAYGDEDTECPNKQNEFTIRGTEVTVTLAFNSMLLEHDIVTSPIENEDMRNDPVTSRKFRHDHTPVGEGRAESLNMLTPMQPHNSSI